MRYFDWSNFRVEYEDRSQSPFRNKAKPDCSYIWKGYPIDEVNVAFLGDLKKIQLTFQKRMPLMVWL